MTERKTSAPWRKEFFDDVIARGGAAGIEEFDKEAIVEFITKMKDTPANKKKGWPAAVKKHYNRTLKMTERGRNGLLKELEKIWPGKPKPKKRKNFPSAPRRKHPTSDLPPPPPPPVPKKGELADCAACSGTRRNSKGGLCICVSGQRRHDYGTREQMALELGRAGLEKKPAALLHGMVERSRQIAEGSLQEAGEELPPPQPTATPQPPPPPPPPPNAPKLPPPPPPPPSAPRLTVEEYECERCGEAITFGSMCGPCSRVKASPPVPPEAPANPSPAPKTYGSPPPPPPPPSSQAVSTICFSVALNAEVEESVVQDTLNRYLVEQTEFGARVVSAHALGQNDYDLLIEYTVHVTDPFKAILQHAWVNDAELKPAADLGKVAV